MNNTTNPQTYTARTGILFGGAIAAVFIFSFVGIQYVYATIDTQLDFGDRGGEVIKLQTYLSSDANIYPSKLVTGYFGPLTKAAVERFQTDHGIVHSGTPLSTGYGRVGPLTRAAINRELAGGGSVNTGGDVFAPIIRNVNVQTDSNGATVGWTVNELSTGRVYYSTSPIRINNAFDATGSNSGNLIVSGTLANHDSVSRRSHSVNINNLSSDTRYYYLVMVTDGAGNVSFTTPDSFHIAQ